MAICDAQADAREGPGPTEVEQDAHVSPMTLELLIPCAM